MGSSLIHCISLVTRLLEVHLFRFPCFFNLFFSSLRGPLPWVKRRDRLSLWILFPSSPAVFSIARGRDLALFFFRFARRKKPFVGSVAIAASYVDTARAEVKMFAFNSAVLEFVAGRHAILKKRSFVLEVISR